MKKTGILVLILLAGFLLRSYNLSFPSIGYHNMKENEYLSIAQEMLRTGDYKNCRVYFNNAFEERSQVNPCTQPPLIPYQTLLSWKLFGENLWGPRLFNACFGVVSIIVVYFLSRLLFGNLYLSLFSALLLAIMPLAIFFSHNIQPESPAFLFMLLGSFFYLRFAAAIKIYDLILGGMSFFISWLYAPNFMIAVLPAISCFPFKRLLQDKKRSLQCLSAFILPYIGALVSILWLRHLFKWEFPFWGKFDLNIFTPSFWSQHGITILWYIKGENFTGVFSILALLGILLAFLKGEGLLSRCIIGWSLAAVLYAIIFSEQLYQQGFAQMPFLLLVCLSVTYVVSYFSQTIEKMVKRNPLPYIMFIVVAISAPFIYGSLYSMHSAVFLAEDVAGESLRDLTEPDERIFLYTYAQGYGIARYAQRYVGWPSSLEDFKNKEKKFNIRYMCFYPAEYIHIIKKDHPEWFEYIQNNYHAKEVGLSEEPYKLFYIILERGVGSDPKTFLESFSGNMQLRTIYRIFGRLFFLYTIRPSLEQKPDSKPAESVKQEPQVKPTQEKVAK